MKPYRVLVVVEQWSDPASVLVDAQKDPFQPAVALLKAWSVPFEILRLDQQTPGASYLFERDGTARYGAVLWLADLSSYAGKNLSILEEASASGTSLLFAGSRLLDPSLEKIAGLKFKEKFTADDPARVDMQHFVTRDLPAEAPGPLVLAGSGDLNNWVEAQGADVLLSQADHPLLAVRNLPSGACGVWMGVPNLKLLRDSADWRILFFRSLVWALGYLATPDVDYSRRFILEMDDWGTSDKGFLSYWKYPTLSEDVIRRRLIAPLAKHKAVLVANVNTGYADRESRRILSPWKQKFTDRYGVKQDYGSTQRGMKAALDAGVMEIQSHGWTHMQPDLDSTPGPWWTASLAGEATAIPWYEEFQDRRREAEVPAIWQRFHLRRSIQYLQDDFGRRPLSLRPGGAAWSKSWTNHTGRLAAQTGFGFFHAGHTTNFYLDRDLVLDLTGIGPEESHGHEKPLRPEQWPPHPDGPVILTVHDRDIAFQPDFLDRLFDSLPAGYRTLSMNEYVAYLHAQVGSSREAEITFDFDDHYCAYFQDHSSSWLLWLADPLREQVKSKKEVLKIELPPGLGRRSWRVSAAQ